MTNYYYLAISLPKLQIGVPPEMSFREFNTLLKENLSQADLNKTHQIRWYYDIQNMRALWNQEPHDYWGSLNEQELEEVLLNREGGGLPSYVFDFLNTYETTEERKKYFPLLLIRFFDQENNQSNGFLKKYYRFERNLRLTLVAFRARQLNRNLSQELQFEDPEDKVVAQLLAQSEGKEFEPPEEFEDLKPLLEKHYNDPLELNKALSEYRFDKIETMLNFDEFSIDRILGYLVQYMMVDQWTHFDKQQGKEILDQMLKDMS
jgi:Protein of unknown function (DUF2764)